MKGVYFQFCSDLYETNAVLSVKMLREVINSEIYNPSILICLGRLEIHFSLSNLDFAVRILTQGHCVRGGSPL